MALFNVLHMVNVGRLADKNRGEERHRRKAEYHAAVVLPKGRVSDPQSLFLDS